MKTERDGKHKRLLIVGTKLRVAGREVAGTWVDWLMGIKDGI